MEPAKPAKPARRGPAKAGEDLDNLATELARKGWDPRRVESLRARWEAVCHDPMQRGRGGRSLPENALEPVVEPDPGSNGHPSEDETEGRWTGVRYRVDPFHPAPPAEINCSERLHLCKAACCKLNFALTPREVRGGKVEWDPELPYLIAHKANGYCSHCQADLRCNIYEDRPALCRRYDCRGDDRIWIDFEGMIPNSRWIEENTSSPGHEVPRTSLPGME
jgi:Fe-S-cluster containining protein